MTTMASPSPKPQVTSSSGAAAAAASSPEEESSVVQVLDSIEPLVTASSSSVVNPEISVFRDVVQELDSNEPLVTATYSPVSSHKESEMQAASDQPPVTASTSGSSRSRVHPYTDELRSMWNWRKVFSRLGTRDQCVQFSEDRGLIRREQQCSYHRRPMFLEQEHGQLGRFRCRKSNCRTKPVSRASGTWFENVRLSITLIFEMMYAFSGGYSYEKTQKELASEDEPVVSAKTIADWFSHCRETIVVYELEHQSSRPKIGGPGKIVQINESKFGRRQDQSRQEHNKKDFTDRLIEYSWRRNIRINHLDPFEEFIKAINYVYKIE